MTYKLSNFFIEADSVIVDEFSSLSLFDDINIINNMHIFGRINYALISDKKIYKNHILKDTYADYNDMLIKYELNYQSTNLFICIINEKLMATYINNITKIRKSVPMFIINKCIPLNEWMIHMVKENIKNTKLISSYYAMAIYYNLKDVTDSIEDKFIPDDTSITNIVHYNDMDDINEYCKYILKNNIFYDKKIIIKYLLDNELINIRQINVYT